MRALATTLGAIAVLVAFASWRFSGDAKMERAHSTTADARSRHEESAQAAELAALHTRVARLEQQLSALQKAAPFASADRARPGSTGLSTQLAPAATVEPPLPAPDLAGSFDRDARPALHTPRTAELESRMKALLPPDASLDRLECRGEICRVELTLPGIKRYHDFIRSAFGNPDTRVWNGAAKFGYLSEPDAQSWEHDEISVYAYLGPEAASAEH